MNQFNHYSKAQGLLFKVLFLVIFFSVSCTKEYISPELNQGNMDDMQFKSLTITEGTVNLEGFTRFDVYAIKEHKVITDGHVDNFLACTAELIFSDKKSFVLKTKEFFILPDGSQMLIRQISFDGKITPGGQIKFSWPETWLDENGDEASDVLSVMNLHMGYVFRGPGINKNTLNYEGTYDGNTFYADMHVTGFQEKPGILPFYLEVVDGPISVDFSIELEVSD